MEENMREFAKSLLGNRPHLLIVKPADNHNDELSVECGGQKRRRLVPKPEAKRTDSLTYRNALRGIAFEILAMELTADKMKGLKPYEIALALREYDSVVITGQADQGRFENLSGCIGCATNPKANPESDHRTCFKVWPDDSQKFQQPKNDGKIWFDAETVEFITVTDRDFEMETEPEMLEKLKELQGKIW